MYAYPTAPRSHPACAPAWCGAALAPSPASHTPFLSPPPSTEPTASICVCVCVCTNTSVYPAVLLGPPAPAIPAACTQSLSLSVILCDSCLSVSLSLSLPLPLCTCDSSCLHAASVAANEHDAASERSRRSCRSTVCARCRRSCPRRSATSLAQAWPAEECSAWKMLV